MDISIRHQDHDLMVILDDAPDGTKWESEARKLGGSRQSSQCPTPERSEWAFPLTKDAQVRNLLRRCFGTQSVPDPTEAEQLNLRIVDITSRANQFIRWFSHEFGEVLSPEGGSIGNVFAEDTHRWKAMSSRDDEKNPQVAAGRYAASSTAAAAILLAQWERWAGVKV